MHTTSTVGAAGTRAPWSPVTAAKQLPRPDARVRLLAALLPVDPSLLPLLIQHQDEPSLPWSLLPLVAARAPLDPQLCVLWAHAATTRSHLLRRAGAVAVLLRLGLPEAAAAHVQATPRRANGVRHRLDRLLRLGVIGDRFVADPWRVEPWPATPALATARLDGAPLSSDPASAVAWARWTLQRLPERQRWRLLPRLAQLLAWLGDRGADSVARSLRQRSARREAARRLAVTYGAAGRWAEARPWLRALPVGDRVEVSLQLRWLGDGPAPPSPCSVPAPALRQAIQRAAEAPEQAQLPLLRRLARAPGALAILVARTRDRAALWSAAEGALATRAAIIASCWPRVSRPLPGIEALDALEATPSGPQPHPTGSARAYTDAAWASRGLGRRRPMIRAALSALRAGGVGPELEARVDVLASLGGARVEAGLRHQILEGSPSAIRWRALIRASPTAALRTLLLRPRRALAAPLDDQVLALLEAHRAIPAGTTRAWLHLLQAGRARPGARLELLQRLQGRAALPDPALLELIGDQLQDTPDVPVTELLDGAEARLEALLTSRPLELARALLEDSWMLRWFRWRFPCTTGSWSTPGWHSALQAATTSGEVDPDVIARVARLTRRPGLAALLAQGRSPIEPPPPLASGHRLRWLDKRRDLLTWQRFADCSPCCYSTRSEDWYPEHQPLIAATWADPLSFCLHVTDRADQPVGFVFGSFGGRRSPRGEQPVLLFNGVYLRRSPRALRLEVLRSLIHDVAIPLGAHAAAIASRWGGYGPVPAPWRQGPRHEVIRHRALRHDGALKTDTYDDLDLDTNTWQRSPDHLYWHELEPSAPGDGERPAAAAPVRPRLPG